MTELIPPKPTPPDVIKAMYTIADYLQEAEYVSVLVGKNGGAIYYRQCPLAARQTLLTEIERLEQLVESLSPPSPHPHRKRGQIMSLQQITYAFKSPTGLVRTVVLIGEDLPIFRYPQNTLGAVISSCELIYTSIPGPIPVPDAPPQSLDDETLAKVRDALEKYGDFYDLALEKRLPLASIVAMIDELTALRARVGGEVAQ